MDVAPGTVCTGREGIAQLGVHLSSLVASTGDTERTFSIMGAIHTVRRSRLSPDKVHKSTAVKMHMKRASREDGTEKPRKRRRFGEELLNSSTPSTPSPSRIAPITHLLTPPPFQISTASTSGTPAPVVSQPVAMSPPGRTADPGIPEHVFPQELIENPFDEISRQLIEEAMRSREDDEEDEEYEPWTPSDFHPDALVLDETDELRALATSPTRASGPRTRKTCIPLRDLFLYSRPVAYVGPAVPATARLDLYWEDGRSRLRDELAAQEFGTPAT